MRKRGFSLPEVLIVVAIIGILVALSIPIFTKQAEAAREMEDLYNMRSAENAVLAKYQRREITSGTFYWDPENGELIDASSVSSGPSCGKGTALVGDPRNARAGYSASIDVSGAALRITFGGLDQSTGNANITFNWIK